jgi:hypothetical protein
MAHAGAWSLPEGEQTWFATVSRESGDFGQAWRADDFNEIGLGDGWGLNGKVESEIRIGSTYDDRSGVRIGVQKAFAIGERASFSVQASLLAGESLDGPECLGGGYEARAAVGTSFAMLGREAFVNVEIGHRVRDQCERTVMEFATGVELARAWNLGLKTWQDGSGSSASAKAEISTSYDLGFIALGVGWRQEISGNFNEKGWVVSASTRF